VGEVGAAGDNHLEAGIVQGGALRHVQVGQGVALASPANVERGDHGTACRVHRIKHFIPG
jgi:hypothetical protein